VHAVNWLIVLACSAAVFAGCNSDRLVSSKAPMPSSPNLMLTQDMQADLRSASCPAASSYIAPQPIEISVADITPDDLAGAELSGGTLTGAWHLTSTEPNFGGLSGLKVQSDGALLAITDSGAFVKLDMLEGAPSGFGTIAYMRDDTGQILNGKTCADSEGLELVDGLALVSFERDHRVLAYDIENCGSAAKGAVIASFSNVPETLGRSIPENEGAEALLLDEQNHLIAGLEIKSGSGAPIVKVTQDTAKFVRYMPRPSDKRLVGFDGLETDIFVLFRAYSPISGNTNEIHAYWDGAIVPDIVVDLKRPFPVDNFEGIAATRLSNGVTRLYIISDNNFSERQRTLLMAFDLVPAP